MICVNRDVPLIPYLYLTGGNLTKIHIMYYGGFKMISTSALYTGTVFSNIVGIQLKTLSGHSSCYVNVCVPLHVYL